MLAFSPSGSVLAMADGEGAVQLWEPENGRLIRTLKGKTGSVEAMAFAPDGTTLYCWRPFAATEVWDVASGKLKASLMMW
jgi:WD40 repeat protein